jgi:NodT family efflux transporter outer membrane factor (OMF) lipoprotein
MRKILMCVSMGGLLSGCGSLLETPYERPKAHLPQTWETPGAANTPMLQSDHWWEVFADDQLDALISRALERNLDLAAAAIQLHRAQLQSGLIDTNLTPDVSLGGSASVKKDLKNGLPSQRSNGTSLTLAYELDLWGKLARTRDAAAWSADATGFDLQGVRLSLIGTTATTYWTIAELNARLADAQEDIASARRVEAVVASRYGAGASGVSELTLARRTTATRIATHEQLQQQRESQRKVLVILLAEAMPTDMIARYVLPRTALPEVQADLPAKILIRRPDVGAAEARIRSNLASYDASVASFFPDVSLTGSVSSSHRDLGQVLTTPAGMLGANLALPFLQWNSMRLNAGISYTQYEESVVAFNKSLYQAFAEVDEALITCTSLAREGAQLDVALSQAAKAESISAARYRAGRTDIRFWLDDQQALRAAKATVSNHYLSRLKAQMTLYQALGGGNQSLKII